MKCNTAKIIGTMGSLASKQTRKVEISAGRVFRALFTHVLKSIQSKIRSLVVTLNKQSQPSGSIRDLDVSAVVPEMLFATHAIRQMLVRANSGSDDREGLSLVLLSLWMPPQDALLFYPG